MIYFHVIVCPWQGQRPAPRASHASATLGSKGYICGGLVSLLKSIPSSQNQLLP